MTYKQIEASREVRLWIGQIIVPVAVIAVPVIAANPELRQAVKSTASNVTTKIKNTFKKKGA